MSKRQKKYYYFAYGSNMYEPRFFERCPKARFVGTGVLWNYQLAERKYTDIDYKVNELVEGVVYEITESDMRTLDQAEGYPYTYRRYWVEIEMEDRTIHAIVYEMTPETKEIRHGIPFPDWYYNICKNGAKQHGIDFNIEQTNDLWFIRRWNSRYSGVGVDRR